MHDRIQRAVDFGLACLALTLLSPVILAVAVAVLLSFGRPVLFRQPRAGRDANLFTLVKFRTMHHVDPQRDLVTDEQRLTGLGRALRATSLDELPTLWNVLRGHMGLVGPRPLLVRYLDRYSDQQARRHEVRPGITGLAQVSGRNALGWNAKFALDVWYVDHRSLTLDAYILVRTVATVLRRDGISAEGDATAPEFYGTPMTPLRQRVAHATAVPRTEGPA